MLVLALVSLTLRISMRLNVFLWFHCVKTDNVQKKNVFSAKYRVLAYLTSFLLNNAFKHKEKLVPGLVSPTVHNLMRSHVFLWFHCAKTDNVQNKKRF